MSRLLLEHFEMVSIMSSGTVLSVSGRAEAQGHRGPINPVPGAVLEPGTQIRLEPLARISIGFIGDRIGEWSASSNERLVCLSLEPQWDSRLPPGAFTRFEEVDLAPHHSDVLDDAQAMIRQLDELAGGLGLTGAAQLLGGDVLPAHLHPGLSALRDNRVADLLSINTCIRLHVLPWKPIGTSGILVVTDSWGPEKHMQLAHVARGNFLPLLVDREFFKDELERLRSEVGPEKE